MDTLRGGPGNDLLDGGDGKDRILCGPGLDVVLSAADDRLAADCEQRRKAGGDRHGWSWWDLWDTAWLLLLAVAALVATAALVRRLLGPPPLWAGKPEEKPASPSAWLPFALPIPILGIFGIGIYTLSVADLSAFAGGLMVAAGVYLVGGLFGFLFGIPKSLTVDATTTTVATATATAAAQPRRFKANTNLEEISDWLTKIIVGLTLIQFRQLIDQIHQLAKFLAPSLGNAPSTPSFAIGIFMVFSISGFLTFYAATRLYGGEFSRAEALGSQAAEKLREGKATGETVSKAVSLIRELEPDIDLKIDSFTASTGLDVDDSGV